jgi:hypothetical protein
MVFGSSFLTRPTGVFESAPTRWGGGRLVIDVTGGPYSVAGLCGEQRDWAEDRFRDFCVAPAASAPAVEFEICRVSRELFRQMDVRGWDYTYDRDYRPDQIRLAGLGFYGRIDLQPCCGGSLWTSHSSAEDFPGVFENFLRVLVAYRVALLGGVVLHSAAIARDGRAFVLVGHSGAGKSTSSALALDAGWEVLSDDMNVVRRTAAGWVVEKLPFAGDLGQTSTCCRAYPVASVLWLEKAGWHELREISMASLLARLLACAPVINEDPFRIEQLMDSLSSLVQATGKGTLRFARDPGFLGLLHTDTEHAHGE